MTNNEAIEELKARKEHYEMGDGCEFLVEALEKGIEALENQKSIIEQLEKAKHEIGNEFVDLQDGSEEWRSYVNDSVLSCYEIVENRIHELKGKTE